MHLKAPHSLHYPITITEILKRPEDNVERRTNLFAYTYETLVERKTKDGKDVKEKMLYPSKFESSVDGTLKSWGIRKGDVLSRPGIEIAEIEEPCAHGVQFGGMCVVCGKDMAEVSYVTTQSDTARANINMIHDNVALTVSVDEASKVEDEAKRRLLAGRKLSLVVDLDQTIIHATVDPTVAEWQKDPDNPNYDAVKDVRAFQLTDEGPGGKGTWYYIKLRPGLAQFLDNISKIYELHIYTMGTRAYAQAIAKLVDPERKIFGDRILSRDESGSMVAKSLQRLFPVDTKMVVIIDDRADVWHWSANLIKVTPFNFFVGIGDINGSFLPKKAKSRSDPKPKIQIKKEETPTTEPKQAAVDPQPSATAEATATDKPQDDFPESALEQLVSMGGGDNPEVLKEQNESQDKLLTAQLEERPLMQKQKQLDAEEDEEDDSEKPRHHLLNDDDNELYFLEQSLRSVHAEFFNTYDQTLANKTPDRAAELRQALSSRLKGPATNSDLDLIPDIKNVMPLVKSRVLAGVNLVFSGVIPLDYDPNTYEIVVWAKSFGAKIQQDVSGRSTTHVVAARNRTVKVRQAVRKGKGNIKIVNRQWLEDCIVQWEHVDEEPYLLKTEDADIGKPFPEEEDENMSESDSTPTSERDTDAENTGTDSDADSARRAQRSLKVKTKAEDFDDDEFAAIAPRTPDVDEQRSPVSPAEWKKMNDELEEFMNESDSDEEMGGDDDSMASGAEDDLTTGRASKRSHAEMMDSEGEGERPGGHKKLSVGPGASQLSQSQLSNDNGLPTPAGTVKVVAEGEEGAREDDDGSQHGWSDFDEDEDLNDLDD